MIPDIKFTAGFTRNDIHNIIEHEKQKFFKAVLSRLSFVALNFVRNARKNGTYTDRTGNLRSSIGYLILRDGQIVDENFEVAGSGSEGQEGMKQAKGFAAELASKHPRGFVLIVVAGMQYAAAVEAKNYDVISNTAQTLEEDLKRAMQQLKNNA